MADATVWGPGAANAIDPSQAQFYAAAAQTSAIASEASRQVADADAVTATAQANLAVGANTNAQAAATLAQGYSQLGFNSSFTAYDFGSIAVVAAYFPIDLGVMI